MRQVRPEGDQDLPERRHREQGRQEDDLLPRHEDVAKKAHQKDGFCKASKDKPVKVKVTGTVEEKDGKLVLTAEKIEKDEKE